ncbi:MAG: GNAT family N-acetyltransferase [Methanomassiliicoccales archaeon]|nr:GNAT family N-acetyltransferase [Methanomassiliicoccales archaeon]
MPFSNEAEFLRVERNLFEYAYGSGINGKGEVRENANAMCFCSSLDIPAFNLAYLKTARPLRQDLEGIELFFRERGNPYTIWLPENGIVDCPALIERGLIHAMSLPAMIADLEEMNPALPSPPGYRLRFVSQESDMDDFADAAFSGYEMPEDIQGKFSEFIWNLDPSQHPHNELVVALKGAEPVASGLMFRGRDDLGLYWISVVPHHRRQGLGSWLAQELLRVGREEGYRNAVLQSSPIAAGLYGRLGFRAVGNFQVYSH